MSNGDLDLYFDAVLAPLYQPWSFDTYPPEGDQKALAACRQFVESWDGKTSLALISPRTGGPGKTGLLVGTYRALLPRVWAGKRRGAFVGIGSLTQAFGAPGYDRAAADSRNQHDEGSSRELYEMAYRMQPYTEPNSGPKGR